jgi:hypothetical protein
LQEFIKIVSRDGFDVMKQYDERGMASRYLASDLTLKRTNLFSLRQWQALRG